MDIEKELYIATVVFVFVFAGCKEKTVVESDYLPIADPYVMLYEGKYYAYGTGGTVEEEGFACFSSDDLKNWTREGQALSAADSYGTWGILGAGSLLHRVEEEVLSVLFHRRAYLRGNGRCSPRPVPSGSEAADMG